MSKINLILSREFTERVRKKSFIITTLLTPILMITLMAAPTLIMMLGKTSTKKVVVVDNSPERFVGRQLKSGSTVEFRLLDTGITAAEARAQYSNADRAYGILIIGSDILSNPGNLQLILNDASSMSVEESINGQIQDILRTERLSRYEIENIDRILADAGIRVNVQTLKNNVLAVDEDSMEATSTTMSWLLGLTLGMLLYFILIVYGQQVLQSVIDEKQTRVLDVIITSCTPFELMMGKILGIALVAALQIVIWAVLVIGVSSFVMPLLIDPASVQAISDPM
jgi:ABC-2 type transport system permease protein